jgi:hypothetical protein
MYLSKLRSSITQEDEGTLFPWYEPFSLFRYMGNKKRNLIVSRLESLSPLFQKNRILSQIHESRLLFLLMERRKRRRNLLASSLDTEKKKSLKFLDQQNFLSMYLSKPRSWSISQEHESILFLRIWNLSACSDTWETKKGSLIDSRLGSLTYAWRE